MPVFRLTDKLVFPPVHLATPEGLLAVGGDLSVERLLLAYKSGIFPWYSKSEPLLWWSPNPRSVLFPHELKISRSLQKVLRQKRYTVKMDTDFRFVIASCAGIERKGQDDTWLTDEMIDAYLRLHHHGYAHSVETWYQGKIVGGLYGVSIGRCFFGESMFSTRRDASKVALVYLSRFAAGMGFGFIDCQVPSDHLRRLGARNVPRSRFMKLLATHINLSSTIGPWRNPVTPTEHNDSGDISG
jgi:leucyl/phenylalanyl-tRNA--protein transferase